MRSAVAALALILAGAASPALAQSQPTGGAPLVVQAVVDRPSLNLSAYGEAKIAPDLATISFGVVTEAPTAAEAMSQNSARMAQVLAALRRAGVAERDIQTSGLNLAPQYTYQPDKAPELRGYQANNRVTVKLYQLDRVGRTADAVVAAGVNQIDGIAFGLRDPQAAEDEARRNAVRSLQAKAQLYAQALGQPLGPLRSLTEGGGYVPRPMPMYARAEAVQADGGGNSVAPGELVVRIDITGVYDLGR